MDDSPPSQRRALTDLPSPPPPAISSVVSALVDDASLARLRANQASTLASLDDACERIAGMTKAVASAYARHAADFVRAARVAKALQDDLQGATRRIEVIRAKLAKARDARGGGGAGRDAASTHRTGADAGAERGDGAGMLPVGNEGAATQAPGRDGEARSTELK